ncbi:hypothetical protein CEXT_521731 [Caerostris extrusa]|uniref:Uncharacterized protein n=1 Tax=Caerostris extrusa TaxID=172846 RepID=A0AAV4SSV8_CAEEX|nr:hypothetical protein CEXT_521731 [Caerostris extrusa]
MAHRGHTTDLLKSLPYLCGGEEVTSAESTPQYEIGCPKDGPPWQECRLLSGIRERQMIFPGIVRAYRIWHHFSGRISAAAQPDAR